MNTIKLELEAEEYGVVERFAEVLGVAPGDVAYAALHRLMMTCDDPAVGRDIVETRAWRRHHLPARARRRPRDPRASRARGGGGVRRH